MEDKQIIELYLAREEAAIAATKEKYGGYCAAIAGNILDDPEEVWIPWMTFPNIRRPIDLHAPAESRGFFVQLYKNIFLFLCVLHRKTFVHQPISPILQCDENNR